MRRPLFRQHAHECRDSGSLNRRDFLRVATGGAVAALAAGCGLGPGAGRGRKLVVWSCGGNYDMLLEFNRLFQEAAGCRITYSSAPVEHLISVLATRPRGVDVLVGRSGPGWSELSEKGRLAGKPEVFALDPYVIIVPPGNPAAIRGVEDLRQPYVRTVYAPTSSGPSGKVVRFLLQAADEVVAPGIWDGYVDNSIEAYDCGWKVFPPVIEGRAHASVTRLSMTTAPETKGKVDIVPIPVEVMAAMKEGHGAIPQRVAPLAGSKSPDLAQQYMEALQGDLGLELCAKHGYIHKLAPEAQTYKPLFKMRVRPGGKTGPAGAEVASPPHKEETG